MRSISPRPEPAGFTNWRAAYQTDVNYGYDLIHRELLAEIKRALIDEQRGLCAYTGLSIDTDSSHIEHLLPQAYWPEWMVILGYRNDVEYRNMVACYPAPGGGHVRFGADFKGSWPSAAERHLFVSPRSSGCEARFVYRDSGKIAAAEEDDEAARKTIGRLGLDDKKLEDFRKEVIDATLMCGKLDIQSAKRRLTKLERDEEAGGRLEPFCFVLKQVLRKHIRKIEFIRESKRRAQGGS